MIIFNVAILLCYFILTYHSDIKLIVLILFAEIIGFVFKLFSSFLSVQISKSNLVMMSVDFILWFDFFEGNSIQYNLSMVCFNETYKGVKLILDNIGFLDCKLGSVKVHNSFLVVALIQEFDFHFAAKTVGDGLDFGLNGNFMDFDEVV